jgi:hypothetical protein
MLPEPQKPHSEKRTYQDVRPSKNLQVCECPTELYSARFDWAEPLAILPGGRLRPYEILAAIVADGMGEVYKAHDTYLYYIVPISSINRLISKKFRNEEVDHEICSAYCSHMHACECE